LLVGQVRLLEIPMYKVTYEDVINNDNGRLRIQWVDDVPFIHLQLYRWSAQAYKEYKRIWSKLLKDLGSKDIPCVFVYIPDNDEKLYHFEQLFGFQEVEHSDGYFLMVKDTE
jgi:hypothetical protein